jgi:hypothetical protein
MQDEMTIEEQVADEAFKDTLKYLDQRAASPDFRIEDIEEQLYHLTVYEGQDQTGRGEIMNSEIDGQIDAFTAFIDRWKKQHQAKNKNSN